MHRRKWDADLNAKLIIQGLQGRSVAELCMEYQISSGHGGKPPVSRRSSGPGLVRDE